MNINFYDLIGVFREKYPFLLQRKGERIIETVGIIYMKIKSNEFKLVIKSP